MSDNSILATKNLVIVRSNFGEIEAYEGDMITKQLRKFGNHSRPEFAFALAAMDPTMNVFDLGSHIGTFSMSALTKLAPGTRLLAVEGSPNTGRVVHRNLARRGHAQIDLKIAFVGSGEEMTYAEVPDNTGASHLVKDTSSDQQITTVSIDALTQEYFEPDYIKVDIEGAEYSALFASDYVKTRKPILYVEISEALENFGHSAAQLSDYLQSLGYEFFVNTGDRNASHDFWRAKRLTGLAEYKAFFDVLCIPTSNPKAKQLRKVAD